MAKKKTKTEKTKKDIKDLAKKEYKYTDEEKARLAKHQERAKRKPVKFNKVEYESGIPKIYVQNINDPMGLVKMLEAFGTDDNDLQAYLLNQAAETFHGCASTEGIDNDILHTFYNKTMAILNGIQPQDEIEGMLAVQMIGVHNVAMETLKRTLLKGQAFEGKQANANQATKMLRTYIAQMEALKKYRTGGQQKMVVEHVHVNEGGQAIVGQVVQGGGKNAKKPE